MVKYWSHVLYANRACFSFAEDKPEGREIHKQASDERKQHLVCTLVTCGLFDLKPTVLCCEEWLFNVLVGWDCLWYGVTSLVSLAWTSREWTDRASLHEPLQTRPTVSQLTPDGPAFTPQNRGRLDSGRPGGSGRSPPPPPHHEGDQLTLAEQCPLTAGLLRADSLQQRRGSEEEEEEAEVSTQLTTHCCLWADQELKGRIRRWVSWL